MISIVIPTYNEAQCIEQTLKKLFLLKEEANIEIIVSDGGSTDNTIELSQPHALIIKSPKGKAVQLNTAARQANGNILFFVHADMTVPPGALKAIFKQIEDGYDGGGFSNIFSSHNEKIKRLGRLLNLRIRNREQSDKNIFYGDNGIFVKKDIFEALGGFKEIPIMEDYDFSVRLRSKYQVKRIKEPKLILDSRRHIKDGFVRTRMKWILIKKLYLIGVSPERLASWYSDVR